MDYIRLFRWWLFALKLFFLTCPRSSAELFWGIVQLVLLTSHKKKKKYLSWAQHIQCSRRSRIFIFNYNNSIPSHTFFFFVANDFAHSSIVNISDARSNHQHHHDHRAAQQLISKSFENKSCFLFGVDSHTVSSLSPLPLIFILPPKFYSKQVSSFSSALHFLSTSSSLSNLLSILCSHSHPNALPHPWAENYPSSEQESVSSHRCEKWEDSKESCVSSKAEIRCS